MGQWRDMKQPVAEFTVVSDFAPTGDQPQAIRTLAEGLTAGARRLTLEGVTGSGKTFTMANVIRAWGRPAIIISHNKTLAAQLFAELKGFFPHNAVEYFVSYYDYYQPEAYIPQTDTYIEKDASINEEIERYRLGATNALLGRRDVVIVASVSCIYGLGSPEDYRTMLVDIVPGQTLGRDAMLERLVDIQYSRNDYEPQPGTFRVRGDCVDIFPSYETSGVRIDFSATCGRYPRIRSGVWQSRCQVAAHSDLAGQAFRDAQGEDRGFGRTDQCRTGRAAGRTGASE